MVLPPTLAPLNRNDPGFLSLPWEEHGYTLYSHIYSLHKESVPWGMQKKICDSKGNVLYFLTWTYWDFSLEFPRCPPAPVLVLDYSFNRMGSGYATYKVSFDAPSRIDLVAEEQLATVIFAESEGLFYE